MTTLIMDEHIITHLYKYFETSFNSILLPLLQELLKTSHPPTPSFPWQPPSHFLSLWFWLHQVPQRHEII
jgi:cell shape-determining protein MreD